MKTVSKKFSQCKAIFISEAFIKTNLEFLQVVFAFRYIRKLGTATKAVKAVHEV